MTPDTLSLAREERRYTVYSSSCEGVDEASFDTLSEAQTEFDRQAARDGVNLAELIDTDGTNGPIALQVYWLTPT